MRERDSEQTLRLFVACELPAEMRAALASLQEALRKKGAPRLRWVRPEGIHLTLKFLGAVPQEKVAAIREALVPTVQGIPPLALSLAEVGTFGGRRGARVLWVGTQGDLEPQGLLASPHPGARAGQGGQRRKANRVGTGQDHRGAARLSRDDRRAQPDAQHPRPRRRRL